MVPWERIDYLYSKIYESKIMTIDSPIIRRILTISLRLPIHGFAKHTNCPNASSRSIRVLG